VSDYAKKLGISDYLIGFLVVSVGTSVPELSTAFIASFKGAGQIILGNVIGANIIDVTLVLGITAIIGKKLFIHGKVLDKTMFLVLGISLLPLILGFDGTISQIDGGILILSFIFYIYFLLRKEGEMGRIKKDVKWKDIWKDMVVIGISIIVLLISANFLINAARFIGGTIGISDILLGLVLVAVGTTIPELTVEIQSILRGVTGIAFGDILGSVVCNSSLVLGIAALINPIRIPKFNTIIFRDSALFMVTSVYIALLFIKKKQITWQEGIGLLMVYATFIVTVLF
jgi:cation:H+ antiporter